MDEITLRSCKQLIENRNLVKSVYPWESGLMHLCCAGIYSAKNQAVREDVLRDCKNLIKEQTGVFSNFRGLVRCAVAAMLATSGSPERTLQNGLQVYELLKKEFWSSTYLPLTAMAVAQLAEPYRFGQIVTRTRALYSRMKQEHPFLTSGEDSAFCALLALSDQTDDALISHMEQCYQLLKPHFFSRNAVQSLSHVLALCQGSAQEKCQRTIALFEKLRAAGRKYGTSYELPTLGVLAMSGEDLDEVAGKMLEIDTWLSGQKGFGFFSGVTAKQRLMYAGILTQQTYQNPAAMETAAVSSTVALIIAQEAAMCAAIAASSAAAASNSGGNT